MQLYAQLPPEAADIYRQLHDGEVEGQFERAVSESDVDLLLRLFRAHRLATIWPEIGDELAAQLLELGQYGRVIEVLREMEWSQQGTTPARRGELAVALMRAGANRAARRALRSSPAELDPASAGADDARLARVSEWLDSHSGPGRFRAANDYVLGAAPFWSSGGDTAVPAWPQEELLRAIETVQRLPLIEPVVSEGALVYRANGRIHAFDALTLTPKWSANELAPERAAFVRDALPDLSESMVSTDARLLLTNYLRHAVALGHQRAFTIESLQSAASGDFGQPQLAAAPQPRFPNELVARDLETGRLLWRTGEDPDGPLIDVEFQDRPLMTSGAVLAPVRRGEHVLLVELDADTGALLREVSVVGPPAHFTPEGGRFLIASDETSIYLGTGNGVVAALRADDLAWQWAATYPSTVAEHLGRLWWKPPVEPEEFAAARAVFADDLLVLAPPDSLEVFALDRFTGREQWRMRRREHTMIVGAVSRGLVFAAGGGLTCLDAEDPEGRAAAWKSVPLEILGHCDVYADQVYVPTRSGVVVIDGTTGKVLSDQIVAASGANQKCGPRNLITTDEAVFAVGAEGVEKYPNASATRRQCEEILAEHPSDERARLGLSWLAALEGDYATARELLESIDSESGPYQASCGRLLRHVFLALADEAGDGAEELAWLRRAATRTVDAGLSAALAIRIGAALEREGETRQAVGHYCEMLGLTDLLLTDLEPDSNLSRAAWLLAEERLHELVEGDRSGAVREAIRAHIERASDAVLMRLAGAGLPAELRDEVVRRVLVSSVAPEHKDSLIGTIVDRLDDARAALCAWEVFVALDRMDEAHAAREAWSARYGSRVDALPSAERERLVGVELAQKKLDALSGAPFDAAPRRQWLLEECELLVDPTHPGGPEDRWLVVRNRQTQELQLINAIRYQGYPRRKTADGLDGRPAGIHDGPIDPEHLAFGQQRWERSLRPFWPMRRWRDIAAIPVRGGLVALGLGPERAGGSRLWEREVPRWRGIPDDFLAQSAVGELGLYLATGPGRIELWGWQDGFTRWRHGFDGRSVRQMNIVGGVLVAWMDDGQVAVLNAMTGATATDSAVLGRPIRGLALAGDILVSWESDRLSAFAASGATLVPQWSLSTDTPANPYVVRGGDWLLVRDADSEFWTVLDTRTGEAAFASPLGPFDAVNAAAMDAGTLRVAGTVVQSDDRVELRIGAYAMREGRELWYDHYSTRWLPSDDHLVSHLQFVPLLVIDGGLGGTESHAPSLMLVDKSDGSHTVGVALENDYDRHEPSCEPYLMVTKSRIIVQVEGNVIGYGNSPLRPGK
jgi:outer membrane protein assembly factor BamB